MQILRNSENIAFLFEQSTMFQVVNTEGLPHRKDTPPTWFGDSRVLELMEDRLYGGQPARAD